MVQTMSLLSSHALINSRMVNLLSWCQLTQVILEKRLLNGCLSVSKSTQVPDIVCKCFLAMHSVAT